MPARALLVAALLGLAAGPGCALRALHEPTGPPPVGSLSARIESRGRQRPKSQASPPAPGLPQSCLTYEQRYRHQYHTGLAHSLTMNAQHPHSKFVVLLKLHKVFSGGLPLDIVLNVRAMAAEVTEAGYHFYILLQPPTNTKFSQYDEEDIHVTREEVLELLPLDLRPFLVIHDYESDFAQYPALGAHDDPTADNNKVWGLGPRAAYTAVMRFMRRYPAYEYVWVAEWDARYTGGSWGDFFNAALSLAQQTPQEELEKDYFRTVNMENDASRALPTSTDGLPDLIGFNGIEAHDRWRELPHNMLNSTQLTTMWAFVYMASRRLFDVAHDYSIRGVGTHLETALPTMAVEQGLKAASIPLPVNKAHPELWHCCLPESGELYGAWFTKGGCTPSTLLHPLKLAESFWPRLKLDAGLGTIV